ETGITDGADASGIANNVGLGLYDIVKHTNYPGFHSMPSDHLACNKAKWDGMPEHHRRIMDTAMQKLALQTALTFEVKNAEAVAMLQTKGINIYNWSKDDRAFFRSAAQKAWDGWAAKTPEADALVKSHRAYLKQLGLIQ
ncbi:MAG: C4-dicarboxylate ABC transporter substrate-binding protein, partial [Alphaproteobacteria bacterium]|nr:C4-dicarboxylate ABC transporter substrate-binding protein [Alphaproteobacteria bacterium]